MKPCSVCGNSGMCDAYGGDSCDSRRSMLWEYRVVSHKVMTSHGIDVWNEIREVYFDKDGNPIRYDIATPSGITINDVAMDLSCMRSALQKPVLYYDDEENKFVENDRRMLDM